jgi:hypothetical protein
LKLVTLVTRWHLHVIDLSLALRQEMNKAA